MHEVEETKISKYLGLSFKVSLGIIALSIFCAFIDWSVFNERYRNLVRPLGILGLVGFGLSILSTLVLRNRL
jgi:hypothetical protein